MKTCIHSSVVSTLLALGFSISSCAYGGAWSNSLVGSGRYEVLIGDGRSDGVTRVYTGGDPKEFSWSGSAWTSMTIFSDFGGETVHGMTIGAARSDGIKRVYGSWRFGFGGIENAEYSYAGGAWNYSKTIGPRGNDIILASGRNDGVNRLYVADTFAYEYTWNPLATNFTQLIIPAPASKVNQLAYGPGRGDGTNRLYGVTTGGHLTEWTHDGTWSKYETNLGIGALNSISIGIARSDGQIMIYIACADGHAYEVFWNGSGWTTQSIGYGALEMATITIGDARMDGRSCVYAGNKDKRIYEFINNNGTWSSSIVTLGPDSVCGIAIGAGRGDGVRRLYATFLSNKLYEYTYTPTTSPPFAAQLLPNGILEWTSTPGGVYDVEWSSDLTTWRSDWSTLTGIPATGTSTQKPIPRFFRVKQRTE